MDLFKQQQRQILSIIDKPKTQTITVIILFVVFCVIFSFKLITRDKYLTSANMTEYPIIAATNTPKQLPLNVYFTKDFTNKELTEIIQAEQKWEDSSKSVAKINLHFYWEPPKPFDKTFYHNYELMTIWKKETTDNSLYDLELSHGFMSVVIDSNFAVILNTDYNNKNTKTVFTHIYGHLFGLEDLKKQYNGVMYIGGNKGEITKYDMKLFCFLYQPNCANANLKF